MQLSWSLPDWLDQLPEHFASPAAAMDEVLDLVDRNVAAGGGPFAAVLLDARGGVLAAGVNRVLAAGCSVLHAEMVAIMRAQARLHSHDLRPQAAHLVSSCEPCAMCLGALPWAGVSALSYAACAADAEAIGFDEGAKPQPWQDGLRVRGIEVHPPLASARAVQQLQDYGRQHRLY